MPSPSSSVVTALMRLTRRDRTFASAESLRRAVDDQLRRPKSVAPPRWVGLFVHLTAGTRHGWRSYELAPRTEAGSGAGAEQTLVYFHGGAYVFEVGTFHWLALTKIARAAGVRVVLPIYPLAPLSTAEQTVAVATTIVADLVQEYGPGNVTVMGDSAGGGLALAVAQSLRDQHVSLRGVVLISPWLDLSLTDPGIAAIEPYDAMLQAAGLVEAGRIYAGSLPVSDPRVSPIHGSMAGLPPVTVFSGTHDLVHPDSQRLVQLAQAAGTWIDYVKLSGGQHVFPLLPIREGTRAIAKIIDLLGAPGSS